MPANKTIDLHVHTNYSDGTDTPAALVQKAANWGLAAVAITDHDTVAGVREGIEQGRRSGVEVIPGVELSAVAGGKSIHILAYGLRVEAPELIESLKGIQEARDRRNRGIIDKLQERGIAVSMDELAICSNEGQAGRPHLARLLHQKKVVGSPDEAFRYYLGKDGAAYVARETLPARRAISIIHKAGGLAVLAHPLTIDPGRDSLALLLGELKGYGLNGLEVYYPNHNPDIQEMLLGIAQEFDLLVTGGSDFHGKNKPNIRMGRVSGNRTIPYSILIELKTRLAGVTST